MKRRILLKAIASIHAWFLLGCASNDPLPETMMANTYDINTMDFTDTTFILHNLHNSKIVKITSASRSEYNGTYEVISGSVFGKWTGKRINGDS